MKYVWSYSIYLGRRGYPIPLESEELSNIFWSEVLPDVISLVGEITDIFGSEEIPDIFGSEELRTRHIRVLRRKPVTSVG